jgi:hypothetical protein
MEVARERSGRNYAGSHDRRRNRRTGSGAAGLGGAAIALFTWWAVQDGGTAPGSSYPGGVAERLPGPIGYPHSIVFRTLAQTGMVGSVLLMSVLAAAVAGLGKAPA